MHEDLQRSARAGYATDPNFDNIVDHHWLRQRVGCLHLSPRVPPARGVHFKVDTHANDVRVGHPLVGWWQLCLSKLNGSGNLHWNHKLINGGKLFQENLCPTRRGGPAEPRRERDVAGDQREVDDENVNLNFGTHGPTEVKTLSSARRCSRRSTACSVRSAGRRPSPCARTARLLGNGGRWISPRSIPTAASVLGRPGLVERDNPNNDPPVGGLGGGQHAQVNIDPYSANS